MSDSMPPLEFEYTQAKIDETVRDVGPESLKNLPYGLDGTNYRWADLDGEGLSGILTEQAGSWFYKANLSPVNQQPCPANATHCRCSPRWKWSHASLQPRTQRPAAAIQRIRRRPARSGRIPGSRTRILRADRRCGLAAVYGLRVTSGGGLARPATEIHRPDRDGFPDLLISDDDAFCWYRSLSTQGFASGQRVPQALDEEIGPKLIFADSTESIFLADISGDGLTDLVRIRNGECATGRIRDTGVSARR